VATKPVVPVPDELAPPLAGDIRQAKPYLLSASPLRHAAIRLGSIGALVLIDLCGVGLGLYGALALRDLYYGKTPILWGVLWDAETNWLPFLTLVTVLVFWQAGLYARREFRAGFGRIVSSLVIVALLTLAFGVGSGHQFTTFGLIPTALVLTAVCIGLFRASYDVIIWRTSTGRSGPGAAASSTTSSASSRSPAAASRCRCSASWARCAASSPRTWSTS
jgi:hypothetical protein